MHCILRPWDIMDAPDLADILNNRHILDHLRDGLPYPYTTQDAAAFLGAVLADHSAQIYCFAITVCDKVVGCISATRGQNIHFRTAEMGYYIAEPYWGRGIATSAVQQFCAFLFANTDILRIFAEPFAENAASRRILEKNGFQCEGILHKNAVKNGIIRDMALYAKVKP
jgi:ribosomal-protein-alanine N-acetyltransferase